MTSSSASLRDLTAIMRLPPEFLEEHRVTAPAPRTLDDELTFSRRVTDAEPALNQILDDLSFEDDGLEVATMATSAETPYSLLRRSGPERTLREDQKVVPSAERDVPPTEPVVRQLTVPTRRSYLLSFQLVRAMALVLLVCGGVIAAGIFFAALGVPYCGTLACGVALAAASAVFLSVGLVSRASLWAPVTAGILAWTWIRLGIAVPQAALVAGALGLAGFVLLQLSRKS